MYVRYGSRGIVAEIANANAITVRIVVTATCTWSKSVTSIQNTAHDRNTISSSGRNTFHK